MFVPSAGRRRLPVAIAAASVCAVTLLVRVHDVAQPAPAAAPAMSLRPAALLDDAGYATVAAHLQRQMDRRWNPRLARYESGPGATTSMVNAELLLVHAVAAQRGLRGPLRADARARAIVRLLTGPQVWEERPLPGADPQVSGPGWAAAPDRVFRHPVYDSSVVDGLVHAYLARDALGLDAAVVARIRRQIHAVATGPDYRWPALRLNQINWYCELFAADAIVNGRRAELAAGMAHQLGRFLTGVPGHGDAAGNLGPGLRFHYLPNRAPDAKMNVDSAEYANIVLSVSRYYGLAREAGMPAPAQLGLLREWVRRVLSGYWTHSGYMNWDSGLGFARWHQRKKMGLAQLALIGVAAQPEIQPGPEWGAWAKWMLDRGLLAYDELVAREGQIPAPLAYGVHVVPESRGTAYLAAARYEANAMRALDAGLGHRAASAPPALYSFDPDTGRLAVTTPAYNTAIVAANQHAFPYGGLDLARLYDGEQQVAANIGGTGDAGFGLVARTGTHVLRTQYGERGWTEGGAPLRLTRAPRGVGASTSAVGTRAYAGPFTDLRVRGTVRGHGMRATSAYRFTPGWIDARWTLSSQADARGTVTFPSWGHSAHVLATLADGRTVALGHAPLAGVRALHVLSRGSGYRVTLRGAAAVRIVTVRPQTSQPDPGPSVAVSLAGTTLAARITVDARR